MKTRRDARIKAVQALYAAEMSGNSMDEILKDPMWQNVSDENGNTGGFFKKLINVTFEKKSEFDELIKSRSQNWDFSRITILDKLILRQALCEFLYFEDIPPKVSIDEAIELSKIFSTEKSSIFINGMLDSILGNLRKEGKIYKTGKGLDLGKVQKEKHKKRT